MKKDVILNLYEWIRIPSFLGMMMLNYWICTFMIYFGIMFISLKISHTSANRVEYTLTSVNKDLQTSITMLPTKVTRFKTYTRKLQKIYYKVFYVCSKLCEICNQSLHRWIHKPLLVSTCLLTFTNQFSFGHSRKNDTSFTETYLNELLYRRFGSQSIFNNFSWCLIVLDKR